MQSARHSLAECRYGGQLFLCTYVAGKQLGSISSNTARACRQAHLACTAVVSFLKNAFLADQRKLKLSNQNRQIWYSIIRSRQVKLIQDVPRQRCFTFVQHFNVKCDFGTQLFLCSAGGPENPCYGVQTCLVNLTLHFQKS